MENVILSLLLLKSMTIYEMKTYIGRVLNTVCSDSMGSIQAALKKLLAGNKITVKEFEENGVLKKEYRITSEGVTQYLTWMQSPIKWYKAKNMEEGKFFYLGMLPREKRLIALQNLLTDLQKEKQSLEQIEALVKDTRDSVVQVNADRLSKDAELTNYIYQVSECKSIEQVIGDVVMYQCYLLEYGLQTIQNDISFFESVYEREKSNADIG